MPNLTLTQLFILKAIRGRGPLMTGQIISEVRALAELGLEQNKTIRTLEWLRAEGLIENRLGGWVVK